MLFNDYRAIQSRLNSILTDDIFKSNLSILNNTLDEKLSDFKPTFMIYGTYNSGKSTLLNAIFGKELADMGDIPTTKEIHEYTYNGFTIYDTPGLNAKIEDDAITKNNLGKSDVIIFTLSNDGSVEEQYVYERICEVVKDNKKTLIVVNNKSGFNIGDSDDVRVVEKISQNLQKVADSNNIKNITEIQILTVNALSGLKAKLENKQKLLENSGCLLLEKSLKQLMAEADERDVENTLNLYIKNEIHKLCQICDTKTENEGFQKSSELVTYLEKQKQNLQNKLNTILMQATSSIRDELRVQLSSGNASNEAINSLVVNKIGTISNTVSELINGVAEDVALKIDKFNTDFNGLNATSIDVDLSKITQNEAMKSDDLLIPDDIKDGVMKVLSDKEIVEKTTKTALEYVKKKLPEIMVGKGEVWIGKTAEAVGKYVGHAISVITAGYSIYKANKEHEEMIRREQDRVHAIQNSAVQISNSIQIHLENEFEKITRNMFNPLLKTYQAVANSLNSTNSNLIKIKSELISISNEIR